jgi:sulfate transport system ATP-binding protein
LSIVLTELTKRFGDTLVVNRVSLEIGEGELFVLLGGSGSGKSTILRLIAGLAEQDSGRIEINNRNVSHLTPQERGTGFVFQNYSIFRHMTAAENVEFGLRIRRVPPEERRRRSEELLELVGLTGLGGRYPSQLSGGQQQRVALARALAYRPEVLLLDEPFGALDAKIRTQLREALKQIQRQLGVTTILVTHDQEEAFELANRIGLLERGVLVEVAEPEALYHRPHSEFAATFIGGGNVLVGRRKERGIQLGNALLPIPSGGLPHDLDAPVRVLFRPEAVHLRDTPIGSDSGLIPLGPGRVVSRTFAGAVRRVRLEMEGLRGVLPLVPPPVYGQHAAHIDALLPSGIQIEHDRTVWVGLSGYHALDPTALKVLICADPEPGGRAACDFGLRLAKAASGPVSLLGVAPDSGSVAGVRQQIEEIARASGIVDGRLRTVARQGAVPDAILNEARDGSYEVVVMGRGLAEDAEVPGMGPTARQILAHAEVPVLLVTGLHDHVKRILFCIAAGEPSKTVVRFGARVARHTRADACVIHVLDPAAGADARERAQTYLDRAVASLESFGVKGESKLLQGLPLEGILQEAERGDYDLLVIGAPLPGRRKALVRSDLAAYIVAGTRRPVAIVPMPR